jgi:hypothetical protein
MVDGETGAGFARRADARMGQPVAFASRRVHSPSPSCPRPEGETRTREITASRLALSTPSRSRTDCSIAFANLARYHREHEKYYAAAPLEETLGLQRISRTLKALAEHWSTARATDHPPSST